MKHTLLQCINHCDWYSIWQKNLSSFTINCFKLSGPVEKKNRALVQLDIIVLRNFGIW